MSHCLFSLCWVHLYMLCKLFCRYFNTPQARKRERITVLNLSSNDEDSKGVMFFSLIIFEYNNMYICLQGTLLSTSYYQWFWVSWNDGCVKVRPSVYNTHAIPCITRKTTAQSFQTFVFVEFRYCNILTWSAETS